MARYVRVASISLGGAGRADTLEETVKKNLERMTELLENAALDKPDIVCFPECSPTLGLRDEEHVKSAEEITGTIVKRMAYFAKRYGMYVVCPMMERRNGRAYNSAVLIDRKGEYVGSYHKVHPTIDEIESGVTPGTESKTFELDFGRVGFAICFDLNFEDVINGLAKNGVELVFFPSMYPGGLQLKIWAFNYGIYVVSAYTGEGGMIVDPLGRVLATSSSYSPVICKTINLDYGIFHIDYNYEKWGSIKRKYGSKVELDILRPEAVFMMTSNRRGVTIKEITRQFQLETRKEYFKRASETREKALESLK